MPQMYSSSTTAENETQERPKGFEGTSFPLLCTSLKLEPTLVPSGNLFFVQQKAYFTKLISVGIFWSKNQPQRVTLQKGTRIRHFFRQSWTVCRWNMAPINI